MTAKAPIIAVDVDDVVADFIPAWLALYNALWQDNLKPSDIKSWDIDRYVKPACGRNIYQLLGPGLYDSVQPIPGALEAVSELRNCGQVIFVSACPRGTADAKADWLVRHGFMINPKDFVACHHKHLIRADYLLDDGAHNLEALSGDTIGILIEACHNELAAHDTGRPRRTLELAASLIKYDLGSED